MKLLMVCLGNICRSPLAHGIMEHLVKGRGLDWEVDSAGTGNWHIGNPPDYRSIEVARKNDIDISGQCCRMFTEEDFDKYDIIFVMDHMNYNDVVKLSRSEKDKEKVRLLLSREIVPDPYWDDEQFEPVYELIRKGCETILDKLETEAGEN